MEVSNGVLLRTSSCYYSAGGNDLRHRRLTFSGGNQIPRELNCSESRFSGRMLPLRTVFGDLCGGFKENGHLDYYNYSIAPVCGKKKKEKKKAMVGKGWREISTKQKFKLLKGLARDLSMFSELGFGLGSDEAKGKVISEAAELLLAQLENLRSEEKKLKSRDSGRKKLKSQSMRTMEESESSSSSFESSDSECEGETVNMSSLRTKVLIQQPTVEEETPDPFNQEAIMTSSNTLITLFEEFTSQPQTSSQKIIEEAVVVDSSSLGLHTSRLGRQNGVVPNEEPSKRIEVCTGGKCKKLGAQALVDEFQRVLGNEGSVAGCKCMGKCKTAPNVRVLNSENEMGGYDSIRTPRNPLCLGVGLEDVELFVASYFG